MEEPNNVGPKPVEEMLAPEKNTCQRMARSMETGETQGTLGGFFYDMMCKTDATDIVRVDFVGRICGLLDIMDMMEQPLSGSEKYLQNRHCEMTGKKKVFQRIWRVL